MRVYKRGWGVFLLCVGLIAGPALAIEEVPAQETAAPAPLNTAAWYKGYWGGIYMADLFVEVHEQEGGRYTIEGIIKTRGLVRMISDYYNFLSAKGWWNGADFTQDTFDTRFNRRKGGERRIIVHYNEDGMVKDEYYNPPEKRWKRPAVPDEQRSHTPDPLTLGLEIRRELHAMMQEEPELPVKFSRKMYDGRRYSDVKFEVVGHDVLRQEKTDYPTVRLRLRRYPIAGYTDNELERMDEEEPDIDIWISENTDFIPLRVEGKAPLGFAYAKLKAECKTLRACIEKAD